MSGGGCNEQEIIDAAVHDASESLTAGASSLHAMSPAEMVAAMEEGRAPEDVRSAERTALRLEIFSGLLDYLFAEGPDPRPVRARAEGFLIAFAPEGCRRISGDREWVRPEVVEKVLWHHRAKLCEVMAAARSRGALADWNDELQAEGDQATVAGTLSALAGLLVSQGMTWRAVTATCLSLAKAFRPWLVAGMSLEHLAKLSGDGGRATGSARINRIYNKRVAGTGRAAVRLSFQKSVGTCAKYRAAAVGNHNRSASRRR